MFTLANLPRTNSALQDCYPDLQFEFETALNLIPPGLLLDRNGIHTDCATDPFYSDTPRDLVEFARALFVIERMCADGYGPTSALERSTMNSSGWKHTVESTFRVLFGDVWSTNTDPYVCNGLFILAALSAGCITADDLHAAQAAGEMSVCPRLSDKALRSAFDWHDGEKAVGDECDAEEGA